MAKYHEFEVDVEGNVILHVPEEYDPYNLDVILASVMEDNARWFPGTSEDFAHHLIALGGEVGELMNLWKKCERGSIPFPDDDADVRLGLASEAADILIYLLSLFGKIGVNPAIAYWAKREYNERRFGARSDDQSDSTSAVE